MAAFDYPIWKDVGIQLQNFKYKTKYLTPERYIQDNPLDNLVVPDGIPDFFGTKVCNIFLVCQPYGWTQSGTTWTESWPPEGFDDSVMRHKSMYEKFTWYETHIYMDYNLVNMIMDSNPDSNFKSMMDTVKGHLQDMCDDLEDFGFTMEDDISSPVDASFFQPVIDAFIKATSVQ